jgi:hypothetical protein
VNAVEPSEILSLADYELARAGRRKQVLESKALRRVTVGGHLTVLFENHETVLYQIQEILRIERISEPAAIRHEIDTYNDLIASADELRATLLIEYAEAEERDVRLRELIGLEQHVWLEVGGAERCPAVFDERQLSERRISSVHYVRFPLGSERAEAVRRGTQLAIEVDHAAMSARGELTPEQTAALADDLRRP